MTGDWQPLDPAYIRAERLAGWIAFAMVMPICGIIAGLAFAMTGIPRWVDISLAALAVLIAPLLVWSATAWPALAYRHAAYRLDEAGIEIRSGVLIRRVTTVPKSRVQHTDVSQGPIERRFGLGTLVIYTAGTEYARVTLPGLQHGGAMHIRDALLPRTTDDAV